MSAGRSCSTPFLNYLKLLKCKIPVRMLVGYWLRTPHAVGSSCVCLDIPRQQREAHGPSVASRRWTCRCVLLQGAPGGREGHDPLPSGETDRRAHRAHLCKHTLPPDLAGES